MIRFDGQRRHDGNNPFTGDGGTDSFTVALPQDETFQQAIVDIGAQHQGGARVAAQPARGTTGTITIRVRWYYSAGGWRTGFVRYRLRVFSGHTSDSVTRIVAAGPEGSRLSLVVLGDGFTQSQQTDYNDAVRRLVVEGALGDGPFRESLQAINVYRVNLISADAGVSERVYDEQGTPSDASDDTITSDTVRNTPLHYIFSGSWAHCWLEPSAHSRPRIDDVLNSRVPDWDYVVIILNNPGFGGCGGGGFAVVPLGVGADVVSHEFGHSIGGLADEYCQSPNAYTGGEPGAPNLTIATSRTSLKWRRFVARTTPIPTAQGACVNFGAGRPVDWSGSDDAGLFEGGGTVSTGIFRPVENCRMNGNSPPFCPVCYTEIKRRLDPQTGHTFENCLVGDFDGRGAHDLVVVMPHGLHQYRRDAGRFELTASVAGEVPGGWEVRPGDRFLVADFDGDGSDEVLAWRTAPGERGTALLEGDGSGGLRVVRQFPAGIGNWRFAAGDQILAGDWDGDGRVDLWAIRAGLVVIMIRSLGDDFQIAGGHVGVLPGWSMRQGDRFVAGDFDGDGLGDLFVFNGADWTQPRAAIHRSTVGGTARPALVRSAFHERQFAGWTMARNDRWIGANWYGAARDNLYVHNGFDWQAPMLGMIMAPTAGATELGTNFAYYSAVSSWYIGRNDRYVVADPDGTGLDGLVAFNSQDWSTEHLGVLRTDSAHLYGSRVANEIGEWNLGPTDRFLPCRLEPGTAGTPHLVVHNRDWIGVIDARRLVLEQLYNRWIHDYRAGRHW
jgi:hypothetical protein